MNRTVGLVLIFFASILGLVGVCLLVVSLILGISLKGE